MRRIGNRIAIRIADATVADEAKPTLGSDPIDTHEIDVVLQSSRIRKILRKGIGSRWPVRRENQQVRSIESQTPRRLRERTVITDMHADPHFIGLHRSIKPLSLRGETIHPQIRQMHLAISRHEPPGANKHTTVVHRTLRTKLQKPKDHMQILGQANLRDRIRCRTRYRLCRS